MLFLADYRQLAEVIVSAIEVNEGRDPDAVVASWDAAAGTVAKALRRLPAASRRRGLLGYFGRSAR